MVYTTAEWTSLNIVSISDIHLGCPANPARMMTAALDKMLTKELLEKTDILFIAGDVFDKGLAFNHDDIPYIVRWIGKLLRRCANANVVVRVLEGTPSHDRMQSRIFEALNASEEYTNQCKLKYFSEIDIEYMEEFGIHVLYIPDEKNTSDDITLEQVRAMMTARAIDKVDFAVMHGFFEFQVPAGQHRRFHDSNAYLDLVRYTIHIGHDHTHQQQGRIFVQGSPDRQRHGMEDPKGMVQVIVNRDGNFKAKFIVNKEAMVFKTIEVSDDIEAADALICSVADSLVDESHLRLAGYRGNAAIAALDIYNKRYPFIKFTHKYLDDDEKKTNTDISDDDEEVDNTPFTIDSANIEEIITSRVGELNNEREQAYLKELISSVK